MMITLPSLSGDSLRDDGPLTVADSVLARRFRLWRGPDGRRQVFSVYAVEDAPDYPDAIALAVRRTGGRCVALWSGPAGAKARVAALATGAQEIHLRIVPETESGPLVPE
ncbi:hypothetical protein GCM10028812_32090 [Ancylobacter sonchi]|uniref:hypothetical protein n=1 Tax=Ancylobacter sonchi TaxID=1937790 RepID=UPI001FE55B84|nr:hypothetical protein [Ancylobacter sonchi]